MDSYERLIAFVGWPDTGALMRRLDDGPRCANLVKVGDAQDAVRPVACNERTLRSSSSIRSR